MYVHKLSPPQSSFIKYRGKTGQIDRIDTILNILNSKPGLIGARIADLIYDKEMYPVSYGKVYEVLHSLSSEGKIVRNQNQYYLLSDAISHDMAVTVNVVKELTKYGYSLHDMRFMSSAIIMAGEAYAAEQRGENFNIDATQASGVASVPVNNPMTDDEINDQINANVNDMLAAEMMEDELSGEIENPFDYHSEDMKSEIEAELKAEVQEQIKKEVENEIEDERVRKLKENMKSIRSVSDLIGLKVDINPGREAGQLVGSVLESRASGMTFLIVYSSDPAIEFGTVISYEYADGLKYKILFDYDA